MLRGFVSGQGRAAGQDIAVRLTKQINVGNQRRVELFAEAFNITNFVNTTGFSGNVLLPTFNLPIGARFTF